MSHVPTRRTVLRTAAWTVPAITVATAAPAFATSTLLPNLSLSNRQTGTISRQTASGTHIRVAAPQFVNTGTAAATGLAMTITSTQNITDYKLSLPFSPTVPIDPDDHDIVVTGLGTPSIVVSFPLPFFGYSLAAPVAPATQTQMTMFVNSLVYYSGTAPTQLNYSVEALNGGAAGAWSLAVPAPV